MKKGFKYILVFLMLIVTAVAFLGCNKTNVLPTPEKVPVVDDNDNNNDNNSDSKDDNQVVDDNNNQAIDKVPIFNFSRSEEDVLGSSEYQNALNTFAFSLFKELDLTQNACISPLSIYLAFAMLSNAADGETLEQIASAMNLSVLELNEYCSYLYSLYVGNQSNAKVVTIANSVWCKNGMLPYQSFINNLDKYYGAEVFKTDFNSATVNQINNWVDTNTKGMIKKIIEEISPDCIMQLINALTFEDSWSFGEGTELSYPFKNASGASKTVKMISEKRYEFYQTDNAEAFIYPFKNSRFGFVGILPNGSLEDYLKVLDQQELSNLISNKVTGYDVFTKLPTFNLDYSTSLIEPLQNLGITHAFNDIQANFKSAWPCDTYNVFVSQVTHKTHVEVSKNGVRAAAVTQIGMECTSTGPNQRPQKYIYLTRPFVYVIMDTVYNVPLFVGVVNSL